MNFRDWISGLFEKRKNYTEMVREAIVAAHKGGVMVTEDNALTSSAVYACVRILSESVASLPLILYERTDDNGKERASAHPLYNLLHNQPNAWQTAFEWRERMMNHLLLYGNAYSYIERGPRGFVTALRPLSPAGVEIFEASTGDLVYTFQTQAGEKDDFFGHEILHIRAMSTSGFLGLSPIQQARNAISLSLTTEQFGSSFFANGATPGVVLEHPAKLSNEAYDRIVKSWEGRHQGATNNNRMAVLEEGMKLQVLSIPPEQAQFLETRKFQLQEIARIFRVPPHMLADLDRATFSNIEQQSLEFVAHSLRPWLVRIEQAMYRDLLTKAEKQNLFVEHLIDGMLRGDIQSRYNAYSVGRQNGWLSANDVRRLENMNPVKGGDAYLIPLNMVDAAKPTPRSLAGEGEERSAAQYGRESRGKRSANARSRLQKSYVGVFRDAMQRVVRREAADIGREASKAFGTRGQADFETWLDNWYEEHRAFVVKAMSAPTHAYTELIAAEAAQEVNGDVPEMKRFIEAYLDGFATRHANRNKARLVNTIRKAFETGGDPTQAIRDELQALEEEQPEDAANEEAVRQNGAISKLVYLAAGVTFLRWWSDGEDCPYCEGMNGKIVGIDAVFLSNGQDYQPEGAETGLKPGCDVSHPPMHKGCTCQIGAA